MPTPRLLDQVRSALRVRYDNLRTKEARLHWIKRHIFFHGKRHPGEMGKPCVVYLPSCLAVLFIIDSGKRTWKCALAYRIRDLGTPLRGMSPVTNSPGRLHG